MADVMADATRHTDQILALADRRQRDFVRGVGFRGSDRDLIVDLAGLLRYWRQACHAADARTDRLRAELDQARWRPHTCTDHTHPEDPT